MFSKIRIGALGALSAFALTSSVWAAPVMWSMPSGSNSQLSYSGGQSDKGLFGDPVVNGASFLFFPSNFEATASNGSAQTTSDRLAFRVDAPQGKEIKSVNIRELGNWSIIGGGQVKSYGTLYLTKLNTPNAGTVFSDNLDVVYEDLENNISYTSPDRPRSEGEGRWTGDFSINLPAGIRSVQVVLNNVLQVTSTAGGSAFIQKTEVGQPASGAPQFEISVVVPEPASLGLLGLTGLALLRRRREVSAN
ncbi:MAG TPA: PEP-CTERM sorting domain-containing protein [Tepidisphaeraceae bacterium]|jgi:MYXO-CTERM domain-containing protein